MLQVKTGVHHLAHIGSEGKVAPEQGFDDTPFRVRQVARIASPISLVFLTIFVCPHSNLLLTDLNSPPGESVKQALTAARGLDCGYGFGCRPLAPKVKTRNVIVVVSPKVCSKGIPWYRGVQGP